MTVLQADLVCYAEQPPDYDRRQTNGSRADLVLPLFAPSREAASRAGDGAAPRGLPQAAVTLQAVDAVSDGDLLAELVRRGLIGK